MANTGKILGLDVGGTKLRLGLVDRELSVSNVEVVPTKTIYQHGTTIDNISKLILDYCRRIPEKENPVLVAAGFPSVVNRERTILLSSTNLPGIDGVNIVEALRNATGIPVIIEHDSYYHLAYDVYNKGIENKGTILGLYFGTGLGNAMFLDGKPYLGKNGAACEIGHMPAAFGDAPCSCGNTGCIEMYCCGKAFEKMAATHFPNTPIEDIFLHHMDDSAVMDFVRAMAVPIATEINILDPDAVFIGGGLVHMKCFPKERLVEFVLHNTRKPYPAEGLQLYFSRNSPENGIIGAAIEGWRILEHI